MKNPDQIEVVLTKFLAVKASGRLAILAPMVLVLWVSGLMFVYSVLGK